MTFSDSYLRLQHEKGLNIYFTAQEALKSCCGQPKDPVKVQYAKEWKHEAKQVCYSCQPLSIISFHAIFALL